MEKYTKSRWFLSFLLIIIYTLQVNGQVITYENAKTLLGGFDGNYLHVDDPLENKQYGVYEFLGVPYAEPPINNLRFRKPIPKLPWNCTLPCHKMSKACVQVPPSQWPWGLKQTHMDEDCLYLNIWTPTRNRRFLKSVLVFIHGGIFMEGEGSATLPVYGGKVLAALGDIVVVVPNYRFGALGFWNNFVKTNTDPNNGLWDIIEVLRWVQDNIYGFYGDKNKVTLAGQGAGAFYISLLSVSPVAKGLYSRLILQSGSAIFPFDERSILSKYQALAQVAGCSNPNTTIKDSPRKVARCMRNVDALQLAEPGPFFPYLTDTELFPVRPLRLFREGRFISTADLLIGLTGNEGVPWITHPPGRLIGRRNGTFGRKDAERLVRERWFTQTSTRHILVTNEYFARDPINENKTDWRLALGGAVGDYFCNCPTIFYASKMSKASANVYFYEFQYRPSKSVWARWVGPTHFDEVDFIFGGPFKSASLYPEEEVYLSKMMMQHWANFVKNGKPTEKWELYGNGFKKMVYVGPRDPIKSNIQRHHCRFWKDYFHYGSFEVPDYDVD